MRQEVVFFVCARKGAGDHQMRGGWGPSSHLVLAVKGWCCTACRVGFVWTCGPSCDNVVSRQHHVAAVWFLFDVELLIVGRR